MAIDYKHPDEAFLRSIDIHVLLPQQEPFVMVSRLVQLDDVRTVCEMDVCADNIFVDDGHLSASGLIENIAQTCAARIGYINKYILKRDITAGVVAAIKKFEIHEWPHIGDVITTDVEVQAEAFGMMLAMATVRLDGKEIATAEVKLKN